MSDKLSFLDRQRDEPQAAAPPAPSEPVAAPPPEPAQAATPPEPQPASQEQAGAQAEQANGRERDPETGKFVPPGLLEERKKRQTLERELQELRAQQAQRQQPQQEQPEYSFDDDPANYLRHQIQTTQEAQLDTQLNISEMIARSQKGDEAVDAALSDWEEFQKANGAVAHGIWQQFMQARHPYDSLLKWHNQHKIISEIGSDPEAWRNAERERIRAELMQGQNAPAVAQTSAPSQQPPPPSLASAPSAARPAPPHVGPGQAFDKAIPR